MAKKKDKPQVINNIQELNLEIDYDKLALAILKAQEHSTTIESYKEDNHEYIQKTLSGKIKKNYLSFSIIKLIATFFYVMCFVEVYLTALTVSIVNDYFYNLFLSQNYSIWFARTVSIMSVIVFLAVSLLLFCILFNIAKEISKEKDRNYIISVFSGIVSFAALIVALVALFKGVG